MSSGFAAKKLLLLGFVVIILVAIPVSVYILQQRSQTKSLAAASTHLFFNPSQKDITALDQTADFAIMVDPTMVDPTKGTSPNQISFAKLVINYDPVILSIDETGFLLNKDAFSTILEGPTFSSGSIIVVLSVGADPSKAIQAKTKIADLKFKVLAEATSSNITFATGTQVLSVSSGDQAGENVLATKTPATVTVKAAFPASPTPTPTTGPIVPTATVTPSISGAPSPSPSPTAAESATPTPEPTLTLPPEEPIPTIVSIEPTGPSDNLITIGIAGLIISIIGGILFFVL